MKNKHAVKLGRLGGLATKKKYGKKHYQKLAQNMNKKRKNTLNEKTAKKIKAIDGWETMETMKLAKKILKSGHGITLEAVDITRNWIFREKPNH